jgi:hypothetical protein
MVTTVLLGLVLLAADLPEPALSEADSKAYDDAKAQAQRDPDAHVRLALWCEAHGLDAQRLKHLAIAVWADPQHATARGLLGLVAYGKKWEKPDAVAEKVKKDEELARSLAEYNEKRAKARQTADAQWELALWCEENGLKAEATAHLATVVRLEPARAAAWRRLGYKKHNGRWMNEGQITAEKAEAEAQKKADRQFKPLLEKWGRWLDEPQRRGEAEKLLAGVSDPHAVPSIVAVFGTGGASEQALAVQLLGQVDARAASQALAILAVYGKSEAVRRAATETLKRRDPREFAAVLIGLLRKPLKYEVRPVAGPGSPGAVFVEGEKFNVERLYAAPPIFNTAGRSFGGWAGFDMNGLPVVMAGMEMGAWRSVMGLAPLTGDPARAALLNSMVANPKAASTALAGYALQGAAPGSAHAAYEAQAATRAFFEFRTAFLINEGQKVAIASQQQLENDVRAIEAFNTFARDQDARVAAVLSAISGQDLGTDAEPWKAWLVNQVGYQYTPPPPQPKPTLVENAPLAYQPVVPETFRWSPQSGFLALSCFGAGTLVRTLDGLRKIEDLQVGDQVLAQDVSTGTLDYQPIVVVYHNPPGKTYRLSLGGETMISSHFHRFWVVGRGWVLARDLRAGDPIRMLGRVARLNAIEPDQVQPLFNLEVAQDHDFFVGKAGALVHDNALPSTIVRPFDASSVLVSTERSKD